MDFIRIGEKLISKEKLSRTIDRLLSLRASGLSQQEVAEKIGVDRPFISRVEALAEVRKGRSVAIIEFPLENKTELEQACKKYGIDYTLLMTDVERWDFVESRSGVDLLNKLMEIITQLRLYDLVIMIGSDMRIRLAEAVLGDKVFPVELGESPIKQDVYFPVQDLVNLIERIKDGEIV